jgi:uncharacterized protein involved in outer membrane biogenesis
MRKPIVAALIVVGVLVVVVIGVFVYAVLNLNGLIQQNRDLILAKASDSLGRKVDVRDIHASLGWGVKADLSGVTISDDPHFSQAPFVEAADIYAKVALLPLLRREIEVDEISLKQPVVRIIRDQSGALNVSSIGKKPQMTAPSPGAGAPTAPQAQAPLATTPMNAAPPKEQKPGGLNALAGISVSSLAIDDGKIVYQQTGAQPVTVSAVNLDVENLNLTSPVDLKLTLAALATSRNFSLAGTVGPLMKNGIIDTVAVPVALNLDVGPLTLDQLHAIPQLAKALPPAVTITNPVSANVKLDGTTEALGFTLATDLTSNRVLYTGVIDKAAGIPLKLNATGSRRSSGPTAETEIQKAELTLGDLNLQAGEVRFGPGTVSARLNSNRFDLASLAKMLVALSKYNASGKAEIHALVKVAEKKPQLDGVITLASVTLVPPGKPAPLRDLSGDIKMSGNSAVVGPMTFDLGSGHARLDAYAKTIEPLAATYSFSADVVKPAELSASPRPQEAADHLDQLAVKGALGGTTSSPTVTAQVTSPSGTAQNIAYRNLAVDALYGGQRVTVSSLKVAAFSGTLDGNAQASFGAAPGFTTALNFHGINLQQALASQKSKASDMVRGLLTGQVRASGRGNSFDQIKPTLNGNGRISVNNGKLIGINVVAEAMRKVQGVPGIDTLVPASIAARHPELFNSPDTDLRQLSMSFVMLGPRITSHDIQAATADYTVKGDGWFDLDKRIDMQARVQLSSELSREIVAQRKNVAYLENQQSQVDFPVRITGQLPKPNVSPDLQDIAQRAAGHLAQKQANKFLNKFVGKIPGMKSGSSESGGGESPSNPLSPLKNLFH